MNDLRICVDCHSMAKLVSKVYDREVIVRDGTRLQRLSAGADFGRPGAFCLGGLSAGTALTPTNLSPIPPLGIYSSKKTLSEPNIFQETKNHVGSSAIALSLMSPRLLVCCRRSDRYRTAIGYARFISKFVEG
ncbi:PREDICTED: pentatricopeptide [Prunus dulcis]|uniref:PREDICTED: pentatricopeptide n=1 Tax=Prunus dulcis TaxID=3755 RepID=A0A5E4EVR4_PRUDU|nr:PREDICTED: pentatricopeptide [Prunus dulcis]